MTDSINTSSDRELLAQLEAGLSARLTLIVAPEGSGKASLIETWLEETALPAARLRFDARHRDPKVFVRDLVLSARQLAPDWIDDLEQNGSCEATCTKIINRLATNPTDLALVIEDYEPNSASDALLTFLLEYLPPQLHLYITATEPPDITSLPRMRVRRQLNEITCRSACA